MFGGYKTKTLKRRKDIFGNDVVVRKHKQGIFGPSHKTKTTYKKDWLGREYKVVRKAGFFS